MRRGRMAWTVLTAFTVLFCAACCSLAAHQSPECSDIAHGRSCSLHSIAESLAVFEDKIVVGATDHIYSFGRDLSLQEEVAMDAQEDKRAQCTSFGANGLGRPESECRHFIKVIQRVPAGFQTNAVDEGQVMVCGTNAFFPKCTIHESSSLSNYSYMTSEEDDEGYSPRSHKDPIVAILASNGRFFSATLFQAFQANKNIGMAKNPLRGDSLFNVKAPASDPLWFHRPDFVSAYEIGEHIYFFMREPAYEVDDGESIVYSRAIRLCKSDNGQDATSSNNQFLTYQKARMTCSYDGGKGSIPYNYDNLESTFLWNGSGGTASTLYGIFSAPDNGPKGSAICKFSFDPNVEGSLTNIFKTGHYTIPQTQSGQQVWITEEPGPFSCPGSTSSIPQRTVQQAEKYQLIDGSIEASNPAEPVHVISGENMDKIAVDVITYNNLMQEVIYFTTESGDLHQAVYSQSSTSQNIQDHVIKSVGGAVNYLSVHQNEGDSRQVILSTEDQVMSITRGDCAQYSGCFECLDSKDAYCGWSPSMKKCINKITQSVSDLIEAHLANESKTASTCGTTPNVPSLPPTVSSSPCPDSDSTASTGEGCSTPSTDGLGNADPASKSDMNIPTIVGATVGAFVLGVPVGAFVCFIFFRVYVRPRQAKNYLEEEEGEENGSVSRRPHSNGGLRLSNVPNGDPVMDGQSTLNKKDLSMSTESHSSVLQHPAPPRYVDVKVKSTQAQLSCSAPTGGNSSPFSASTSNLDMMFKRSSMDVVGSTLMNAAVKDDSAFGGSENDLVPPLVHLTGSDGFGTYKKPSKHSKYPINSNGVSRTQVPGHKVPKGRTPSTTWLRENSVSDGSDLSSPLQSPISDV